MRITTIGIALFAAAALALPAAAQTAPTPPTIARTVVAATKLPSVVEAPLYFKAVRLTLQPGGKSSLSAANGILYQLSGSTELALGGENKALGAGEALFAAAGKPASLSAGAPAAVTELYRTTAPIPDLKPGGYDLNLTRVTFPAGMPSNPPHHRSGAALYYIVSGTGANTRDGKVEARGPGSLIYEPFGLVHRWGNPGGEPLTFLAFNINPDGVAAVFPGAPAKAP